MWVTVLWFGQSVGPLTVELGFILVHELGFLEPISYEETPCSASIHQEDLDM